MIKITHQLESKDYYIPKWSLKYLFIGTFNPEGGDAVAYYYGREKNKFWPILRELTGLDFDLNNPAKFYNEIKQAGIGCIDMIHAVELPEKQAEYITGKGYSDSKIINNKVARIYNTQKINELISKNPGVNVLSTWGQGSNLSEWKNEVEKIQNVVPLVSPSMAARVPKGTKKFQFMVDDWRSKIDFK